MEIILGALIVILLFICIYLAVQKAKAVSKAEFDKLCQYKQDLEIEYAKVKQFAELQAQEKEDLKKALEKEKNERNALERTLEGTNAYLQAQQEKFEEQKDEIQRTKVQFNNEFQVLANKILEEKSQKFTALNQQYLGVILDPLKEKIKTFEEKVEKSYAQESAERNVLKGVVEQLMQQSLQIKDEANNLTRALKGDSKKQGNWGEVILERVLERSGLSKDQEYRLQASLQDEFGRRLQPDAIIDLPDDKQLVVDSKVSLIAYDNYINAETEEELALHLKLHVQSIENHVKELSAKNYHSLYGIHSPDFVLLFIPIESALSVAVMQKPELFSDAWDRRVVIVSPSTLLATLRTIASMWKQERQNRNVLEIAREAGALYDKFVGFLTDMQQIQVHLNKASEKHDEAMKKLSTGAGNVVRRVENLKTLGAKANKQIDDKYLDT
ncbi:MULTISPECIES: DNA recombination protein RmuC [Sphingobacterium]|uniref:DNA recombination protein RmuC n=1 Tax=Sphingobacterium litopenaei TaxID=2763500 RepID=A0ABR7YII7_9SPHI|nr:MULTISPECIES: DNA recombination protein RmuC [Sphingobacterium]MBD1431138.1 DNA recombination protein RmuC [Sphingobacterium litopenaei]NGM74317.1 DNA recombination protein RmuC [Sphingobacterium sp. SGL-16]